MHFHRYRDWTLFAEIPVTDRYNGREYVVFTEYQMVSKCSVCTKPKFKVYRV